MSETGAGAVAVRRAALEELEVAAQLLHDFNVEFETLTPAPGVLAARLREHHPGGRLVALLAGEPAVGVALVSLRPSVWTAGPVATLDELYVRPARRDGGLGSALLTAFEQLARERGGEHLEVPVDEGDADARRFYERHGFACADPDSGERYLLYERELA